MYVQSALLVGALATIQTPPISIAFNAALIGYNIARIRRESKSEKIDYLTGLPSSVAFTKRLNEDLISEMSSSNATSKIFIAAIDIKEFSTINSLAGIKVADSILKGLTKDITELPGYVIASRASADIFHVFLKSNSAIEAKYELNCLKRKFEENHGINGYQAKLAIGLAQHDWGIENSKSVDLATEVTINADIARYLSKKSNNELKLYNRKLKAEDLERMELKGDLTSCIDKDEILVYYQPKYSLRTKQVIGLEALCRWQHSERGIISPAYFIPLAEETGYIDSIGSYVALTALDTLKQTIENIDKDMTMAINVSIAQLESRKWDDYLKMVLIKCEELGLETCNVEFEITETIAASNAETTKKKIERIRSHGFKVSIDDFGVGHSSLHRLSELDVDYVKIDKSFVDRIDTKQGRSIFESIVRLAKSIDAEVIAEGIETVEQLETINKLGCDIVQGFLLSKPISREHIIKTIEKIQAR
ncbi:EAL domain-containing protein [Vibrio vulnificus]|nr:EAL domain-containing protein [Vibrio vulnificus]